MFYPDQQKIEQLVWSNPQYIYRAAVMVRLSIRRRFELIEDMVDHTIKYGVDSLTMAADRRSCEELSVFSQRVYNIYSPEQSEEIFREALQVYGLGLAKAGFLTQLLTGQIGCLDSHNIKMYALNPKAFRLDGNWQSVEKAILSYKAACLHAGGSEILWNNWCNHLAAIRPYIWQSGERVSQYHVQVVRGEKI